MSDPNDLIRRGDALREIMLGRTVTGTERAIAALPADPQIAELRAERARLVGELAESRDYAVALEQELHDRSAKMSESAFDCLILDAMAEAMKAMRKFPQPNYVISKVAEEAGEPRHLRCRAEG